MHGSGDEAQIEADDVEVVEVVETSPLGVLVDLDKMSGNVQVASSQDMREERAISLAEFLNRSFGSVFVNEAQSNPLQPDLQYRGYVGSPLLGLPQGIAVYVDGVRVNEPFGDTVNWVLIPDVAIDALYLVPGANPVYGLNALGGAISVHSKRGAANPGSVIEAQGGSFGRAMLDLETGGAIGDNVDYYLSGSYLQEGGWRDFSPSRATQLFTGIGWQSDLSTLDARVTYADTDLIGNGATPVDLLAQDRKAIFTRPDQTQNDLVMLGLTGTYQWSDSLKLAGNLYLRASDVASLNGDDSDFEECEEPAGFICEGDDEEIVVDTSGGAVMLDDALIGATVNRTQTQQDTIGFDVQATWANEDSGRRLTLGLAHDTSDVVFAANTELGALDATRRAVPGGVLVGESFTRLHVDLANTGVYFTGQLAISRSADLTLSGRFNAVETELRDQLGTALDGKHRFERFNPAIGLTWRVSDAVTFYSGYSESNRAPSPVELTCADEDDPCRLPNAFLSDPPLDDVVARTIDAGVRGFWRGASWHAGVFQATNEDDILFISAGALTNQGFFDNVGTTRRRGLELNVSGGDRVSWYASYTYLRATFEETFAITNPNHPSAIDGEVAVERGDRLPLIPDHLLKAGMRASFGSRLAIGANLVSSSGGYLRGDEGNLENQIGGYAIVNLNASFAISSSVGLTLSIDNVFDTDYETFGLYGEPDEVLGDDFDDPRFLSPGAPRGAWLGIRVER